MKKLARRQQQQKQSVSPQEKRDSQAQHTGRSMQSLQNTNTQQICYLSDKCCMRSSIRYIYLCAKNTHITQHMLTSLATIYITTAPSCGALPTALECTGSYVSLSQQNINLESYSFKLDPFRQGLTPPQMPGDHMHPYGRNTYNVYKYRSWKQCFVN